MWFLIRGKENSFGAFSKESGPPKIFNIKERNQELNWLLEPGARTWNPGLGTGA